MGVCVKWVSVERGSAVINSDSEQQIHKVMNSGEPKLSHCKSYRVLTCLYHQPSAAEQLTTSFLYQWRSWAISDHWLSFGKLSGSLRRQWIWLVNKVHCLLGFLLPLVGTYIANSLMGSFSGKWGTWPRKPDSSMMGAVCIQVTWNSDWFPLCTGCLLGIRDQKGKFAIN